MDKLSLIFAKVAISTYVTAEWVQVSTNKCKRKTVVDYLICFINHISSMIHYIKEAKQKYWCSIRN